MMFYRYAAHGFRVRMRLIPWLQISKIPDKGQPVSAGRAVPPKRPGVHCRAVTLVDVERVPRTAPVKANHETVPLNLRYDRRGCDGSEVFISAHMRRMADVRAQRKPAVQDNARGCQLRIPGREPEVATAGGAVGGAADVHAADEIPARMCSWPHPG